MSPRDKSFEEWIARARAVSVQDELARRGLWSRAMAGDAGVPCPMCGGRDRFAVNLRKNVWNCRASGAAGDAIALAMHIDGVSFLAAVEIVNGTKPSDRASELTDLDREEIRARAAEGQRARDTTARKTENDAAWFRARERRAAWDIWAASVQLAGTPAAKYLALRGLSPPRGARLRFHRSLPFFDRPRDLGGKVIHEGPALIGAIEGPDGRFSGIQRTWIDLAKPGGKAVIADPKTGEILSAKKARGSVKGGTIRCTWPDSFATRLFLGEGTETVLSVYCALSSAGSRYIAGGEFRAAVSLGNLAGPAADRARHPSEIRTDKIGRVRPHFVPGNEPADGRDFPMIPIAAGIKDIYLLGDCDSEPFFTRMALERAAKRFSLAYPNLTVYCAMAAPGMDFNDVLLGKAA